MLKIKTVHSKLKYWQSVRISSTIYHIEKCIILDLGAYDESQKITLLVKLLSRELWPHFQEKKYDILRYDRASLVDAQFFVLSKGFKGKTTFPYFCKVGHLNYIYILRSRQLKLQDMIGHVLQMCNEDFEFSLRPRRNSIYISKKKTNDTVRYD